MSASGSASMVFMCFGSLAGEVAALEHISKAPASGGWISLEACQWSGSMNYGGRAAEQTTNTADAAPVVITKVTDAASPGLLRQAILGDFSNQAVITFVRTGETGKVEEYLRLELQDCGITSFDITSTGGQRSLETFTIKYAAISVRSFTFEGAKQRNQISYTIINQS